MLLSIAQEKGRFEFETDVLLCFDRDGLMADILRSVNRGTTTLAEAANMAAASVYDPSPRLADGTVAVRGKVDCIPVGVRIRAERANSSNVGGAGKLGILPRDLSAVSIGWMEDRPTERTKIPFDEAHADYLSVWKGCDEIGVFHRNGMKHGTALRALLRSGVLDGLERTDDDVEAEAGQYEVTTVSIHRTLHGDPPRAPRRSKGTAPTSDAVRERIETFRKILRVPDGLFVVPPLNAEATKLLSNLSKRYHEMKANGTLPATDKQIEYVNALSKQTGIPLPENLTWRTCNNFIDVVRFEPHL